MNHLAEKNKVISKIRQLDELTSELARESNHERLLELVIFAIKKITNADGGTLYIPTEDNRLQYEIIINSSMNVFMGGTSGKKATFNSLPLYLPTKEPNHHNIACHAYLADKTVNLQDAYKCQNFDFSGTKAFDRSANYRTKSVLAIPLKNLKGKILGIIQIINALDENNEIVEFSEENVIFAEFLASHAATTLTNLRLTEDMNKLFESLAQVIATAIDDKSPYTGNHCHRVPEITMMLTDAINNEKKGQFKNTTFDKDQRNEIKLAALLHDCGKVSTPVHVIDKSTKLETIFDRIKLIETRFEVLKKDLLIATLENKLKVGQNAPREVVGHLEKELEKKYEVIDQDLEFIKKCNAGQDFTSNEDQQRIMNIGTNYWWHNPQGIIENILTDNEMENLCIQRGTLTESERRIINRHIDITIKMLEHLQFPDHLKNIPLFAGTHHEKLDGTGYPRGLSAKDIPMEGRIISLADVFEALTAQDRPYKKGKMLSETLRIIGFMVKDGHLDQDLFNIFIDKKIYLQYAEKHMNHHQIDTVDISKILGYVPPEQRNIKIIVEDNNVIPLHPQQIPVFKKKKAA